jgi:hypothetical protein
LFESDPVTSGAERILGKRTATFVESASVL